MNTGCPPTARHDRTGLLTPPGITRAAASKSRFDSLATRALVRRLYVRAFRRNALDRRARVRLQRSPRLETSENVVTHAERSAPSTASLDRLWRDVLARVLVQSTEHASREILRRLRLRAVTPAQVVLEA